MGRLITGFGEIETRLEGSGRACDVYAGGSKGGCWEGWGADADFQLTFGWLVWVCVGAMELERRSVKKKR